MTHTSDWLSPRIRDAAIKRSLTAGQALFRAGMKSEGMFEVVRGTVRLLRVDRDGRETVLHSASAGDTIAEASLYSSTYHCDATATTDAVVWLYPKAAILKEFDLNPTAARAFSAKLAQQVMTLRTRVERGNIRSARDRIRHYLATNAEADGRTVALHGSLKELATELGLTHEALYRTLAAMVTDGEIERRSGSIRILKAHDLDHTRNR